MTSHGPNHSGRLVFLTCLPPLVQSCTTSRVVKDLESTSLFSVQPSALFDTVFKNEVNNKTIFIYSN